MEKELHLVRPSIEGKFVTMESEMVGWLNDSKNSESGRNGRQKELAVLLVTLVVTLLFGYSSDVSGMFGRLAALQPVAGIFPTGEDHLWAIYR
jgi:hypothetical protein